MSKKAIAIVLTFVLLFSFAGTVFAAPEDAIDVSNDSGVKFTYISSTSTALTINALGKASCVARISAYDCVDLVYISSYLQRYDNGWQTVKHWTGGSLSTYYALLTTWYVTTGYQYRFRAYYYAYDGDNVESVYDTAYWNYE